MNRGSMVTTGTTDSGFAVHWIKYPKINVKACLLLAGAVLLPILIALLVVPHRSDEV
jgi:hypothetical protein